MELRVSSSWRPWVRRTRSGLLALGLGLPIVLVRLTVQSILGAQSPFILAWPAAMLAAFIGGFWPAMIITLVGLSVGQWALRTAGARPLGPGGALIFMAFGLVFAVAGELRQRGLSRARADAARLDEMQQRLTRVARLNAMGEIAATLAHELNQPLTAIAGYAGAAERLIERGDLSPAQMTDLLRKVAGQTTRARDIIGRIRAHVSQGEPALASHSVSEIFKESVPVALAGTGVSVTVRQEFDPGADLVLADAVQVQQVVVNLIRNAAEAMANRPRRELLVGSRPAENGLIESYVADSGPGLAPEVAARLFEPFVTGKADGMGIGLSVCRSIVEAHGGAIHADSDPGRGATFRFTLRRAGVEAA